MIQSLKFIFWFSILAILHSYIFYPFILNIIAKFKSKSIVDKPLNAFANVFVMMSLHNEEAVIKAKLESIYTSNYPKEKIHLYIGSDDSTDKTNQLVEAFKKKIRN